MKFALARVSGCQQAVSDKGAAELEFQINGAMKRLYEKGCRRFRSVRLAPNGDDVKFMVMGWPS